MLLSVIIPTLNRRESLNECLKLLAPEAQNVSADLFEVVVTDDAFENETGIPQQKVYPWLRRISGPQKGPASNRNNGARAANGDWIIFLDDDCLPQPTFLSGYLEAITEHPDYLIFEGSTLPERPRTRLDEEAPINEQGGYLWSCNFLIQKQLFFELGGYCELYPYACMEDVDFREQLKERKVKFLFTPKASVIHPWRSMAPEDKFLHVQVVSHAIYFRRYPMRRPSFFDTCRSILRVWIAGLFVVAPSLKFRGFKRYLVRKLTETRIHILIRQQSPAA
jgi:glycosyltransferase involved in cell wall biosynthesis